MNILTARQSADALLELIDPEQLPESLGTERPRTCESPRPDPPSRVGDPDRNRGQVASDLKPRCASHRPRQCPSVAVPSSRQTSIVRMRARAQCQRRRRRRSRSSTWHDQATAAPLHGSSCMGMDHQQTCSSLSGSLASVVRGGDREQALERAADWMDTP